MELSEEMGECNWIHLGTKIVLTGRRILSCKAVSNKDSGIMAENQLNMLWPKELMRSLDP